jgi:hypothetical protein
MVKVAGMLPVGHTIVLAVLPPMLAMVAVARFPVVEPKATPEVVASRFATPPRLGSVLVAATHEAAL